MRKIALSSDVLLSAIHGTHTLTVQTVSRLREMNRAGLLAAFAEHVEAQHKAEEEAALAKRFRKKVDIPVATAAMDVVLSSGLLEDNRTETPFQSMHERTATLAPQTPPQRSARAVSFAHGVSFAGMPPVDDWAPSPPAQSPTGASFAGNFSFMSNGAGMSFAGIGSDLSIFDGSKQTHDLSGGTLGADSKILVADSRALIASTRAAPIAARAENMFDAATLAHVMDSLLGRMGNMVVHLDAVFSEWLTSVMSTAASHPSDDPSKASVADGDADRPWAKLTALTASSRQLASITPSDCFCQLVATLPHLLAFLELGHSIPSDKATAAENTVCTLVYHIVAALGEFPTATLSHNASSTVAAATAMASKGGSGDTFVMHQKATGTGGRPSTAGTGPDPATLLHQKAPRTLKDEVAEMITPFLPFLLSAGALQLQAIRSGAVTLRSGPPISLFHPDAIHNPETGHVGLRSRIVPLSPADDYFWLSVFSLSLLGPDRTSHFIASRRAASGDLAFLEAMSHAVVGMMAEAVKVLLQRTVHLSGLDQPLSAAPLPLPCLSHILPESSDTLGSAHSDGAGAPSRRAERLCGARSPLVISMASVSLVAHMTRIMSRVVLDFPRHVPMSSVVATAARMSYLALAANATDLAAELPAVVFPSPHDQCPSTIQLEFSQEHDVAAIARQSLLAATSLVHAVTSTEPASFVTAAALTTSRQQWVNVCVFLSIAWRHFVVMGGGVNDDIARQKASDSFERLHVPALCRLLIKLLASSGQTSAGSKEPTPRDNGFHVLSEVTRDESLLRQACSSFGRACSEALFMLRMHQRLLTNPIDLRRLGANMHHPAGTADGDTSPSASSFVFVRELVGKLVADTTANLAGHHAGGRSSSPWHVDMWRECLRVTSLILATDVRRRDAEQKQQRAGSEGGDDAAVRGGLLSHPEIHENFWNLSTSQLRYMPPTCTGLRSGHGEAHGPFTRNTVGLVSGGAESLADRMSGWDSYANWPSVSADRGKTDATAHATAQSTQTTDKVSLHPDLTASTRFLDACLENVISTATGANEAPAIAAAMEQAGEYCETYARLLSQSGHVHKSYCCYFFSAAAALYEKCVSHFVEDLTSQSTSSHTSAKRPTKKEAQLTDIIKSLHQKRLRCATSVSSF